jgi:hypothetical protein
MLFKQIERDRTEPLRRGEKLFDFYDSRSGGEYDTCRNFLNLWISEFPEQDRTELLRRMTKNANEDFAACIVEILLHAFAKRLGYSVDVHVETPTKKKIDFKILNANSSIQTYLEATSFSGSHATRASDNREAQIYNAIEKTKLPNGCKLAYSVKSRGTDSPALRLLIMEIEKWAESGKDSTEPLTRIFEAGTWKIELSLFCRLGETSKKRNIVASSGEAKWVAGHHEIRDALDEKASKYGNLNAPLIIAVADCKGELTGADNAADLFSALFGDEVVQFSDDGDGKIVAFDSRKANGFWGTVQKPKNSHVSAVILIPDPDVWKLRSKRWQPILVKNPWAKHFLSDNALSLSRYFAKGDQFEFVDGNIANVLGLPDPWPPE